MAMAALTVSHTHASADVVFSVRVAPPPLPVYEQPPLPGPDYLWTPGYWAWSSDEEDYYWVPGAWVLAPEPELLWTPGYWAWRDGYYGWYDGYWGPTVGYYGGVVYGFGYVGTGYYGGYWRGGSFYYNRSVYRINNTVIQNVYNKTVIVNQTNITNVSFHGGPGGTTVKPTPEQLTARDQKKFGPVPTQIKHVQTAALRQDLRFSKNNGRPPIAAVSKAATLSGPGIVRAKQASAGLKPQALKTATGRPLEGAPVGPKALKAAGQRPPAGEDRKTPPRDGRYQGRIASMDRDPGGERRNDGRPPQRRPINASRNSMYNPKGPPRRENPGRKPSGKPQRERG